MSKTTTKAVEPPSVQQFNAHLPLGQITKHPKNPRHKAVADDELIDSVKATGLVQPLVVAPAEGDNDGAFVLIAGHRRLDAVKKAKHKTAPAIIRHDLVTEAQQVEAMLIENGRRVDLTPVEEAEGYHQLELFGYKPQAIATAVGRDVKTVRGRLKLLKLSDSTRKKIHAGQLTLDDAAAFAEFAGDREATTQLEKAAADGQLRYTLQRIKDHRERLQKHAARVADLADRGVPEYHLPEGTARWEAQSRGDIKILYGGVDDLSIAGHHDGCLAYLVEDAGNFPSLTLVCTDPAKHATAEQLEQDAADAQRQAESEARQQRWEQERAARAAAAKVRATTVLDLLGTNTVMPPVLRDTIRAILPALIYDVARLGEFPDLYFDLVGIDPDDRWNYLESDAEATRFAQHVEDIDRWSDGVLTRALVALMVSIADFEASSVDSAQVLPAERIIGRRYLGFLEQIGHEFCDVDQQLRGLYDAEPGDDADEAVAS